MPPAGRWIWSSWAFTGTLTSLLEATARAYRRDLPDRPQRQRQDDHHLRLSAPSGAWSGRPAHRHHRRSGGAGARGSQPVAGSTGNEFDFARGLRSLLRQDPEVIMIGEVRDRETAGDRRRGGPDRPSGAQHAARRLGLRRSQPTARNGHRTLPAHQQSEGHPQPAAGAPALSALP